MQSYLAILLTFIIAGLLVGGALEEANRKLVEIFKKKIQAKLAEIWGEEKTI